MQPSGWDGDTSPLHISSSFKCQINNLHLAYTPSASWVLTIHVSLAEKSKALPRSDCETPRSTSLLPIWPLLSVLSLTGNALKEACSLCVSSPGQQPLCCTRFVRLEPPDQKTQCITPEENAAACQSAGRTWNTRNKMPPAPSKMCAENSAQP